MGQAINYNDDIAATGYITKIQTKLVKFVQGKLGSILNTIRTKNTKNWQDQTIQSRVKILYFFGQRCYSWF